MKKVILILPLFFLVGEAFTSEWIGPFDYNDHPPGFVAGAESNGDEIYLSMALNDSASLKGIQFNQNDKGKLAVPDPGSHSGYWVIGGVSKSYRGARYVHEGRERHAPSYLLFSPTDDKAYHWVAAQDGAVPDDAVAAWGSIDQYVCRASWAGGVFPGRISPPQRMCLFGYGGVERAVFLYEVLVRKLPEGAAVKDP